MFGAAPVPHRCSTGARGVGVGVVLSDLEALLHSLATARL